MYILPHIQESWGARVFVCVLCVHVGICTCAVQYVCACGGQRPVSDVSSFLSQLLSTLFWNRVPYWIGIITSPRLTGPWAHPSVGVLDIIRWTLSAGNLDSDPRVCIPSPLLSMWANSWALVYFIFAFFLDHSYLRKKKLNPNYSRQKWSSGSRESRRLKYLVDGKILLRFQVQFNFSPFPCKLTCTFGTAACMPW